MDGVLKHQIESLLVGAERSLIAMRRKGMALNPAYIQLNEATAKLRNELIRREQNAPRRCYAVRFLMEKEFRISVDGKERPWLVEAGDVYDIHNYFKDGYVVRSPDISKTQLMLRAKDEGYLYERLSTDD